MKNISKKYWQAMKNFE